MPAALSLLLVIPAIGSMLAAALIHGGWFFTLLGSGPLAAYGIVRYRNRAEAEPNATQLDMVMELLRLYPDDWKIEEIRRDVKVYRGEGHYARHDDAHVATRYALHDHVRILVATSLGQECTINLDPLTISVFNPERRKKAKEETVNEHGEKWTDLDAEPVRYIPNWGYRAKVLDALKLLRTYREMHAFVGITVDADERRSAPDRARQRLEDFRAEHQFGTSMEDAGVSLDSINDKEVA